MLEPAYQLDALLIMPRDHPLARRRQIAPQHLKGYPLVNAPEGFSRPEPVEILRKLGIFGRTESGPIGFRHRDGQGLPVCRDDDCQALVQRRARQAEPPEPCGGEPVKLDLLRAELAGVEVQKVRFTSECGLAAD